MWASIQPAHGFRSFAVHLAPATEYRMVNEERNANNIKIELD